MLKMYFNDDMGPKQIGRHFRESNTYVSRVVAQFKLTLKKKLEAAPKEKKVAKCKDPQLLAAIRDYIK